MVVKASKLCDFFDVTLYCYPSRDYSHDKWSDDMLKKFANTCEVTSFLGGVFLCL